MNDTDVNMEDDARQNKEYKQKFYIKTCSLARVSVNGFTIILVAKLNINPKVIEIGSAGRAFL